MTKHALIPSESLLQHIAIVGKTGSGKTVAAKGEVEKLLDHAKRVCVLDPTGAWWGLKHSADGRGPGYPLCVFGGDHGDVPINEHAGEALGRLVATTNTPCIVDLSGMTTAARHRFALAFFEAVYHHNRKPIHLVVDEADEFAPQSGAPGTERMLGAFDRIIRRGRIKGFCVVMITQRPAVLNKNALTQANTLVAMRLPSSQDRKAIELWIKGQGDEEQANEMMGSLAGLKRGEGWVWAPECNVLERVQFPMMRTFDSSKTPEDGQALRAPTKPAEIDVSEIRKAMAAAIEQVEREDPKALQERVSELKKKLESTQNQLTQAMNAPIAGADARVVQVEHERDEYARRLADCVSDFRELESLLRDLLKVVEDARTECESFAVNGTGGKKSQPKTFFLNENHTQRATKQGEKEDYGPKLLRTLAWLEGAYVFRAPRETVATLANVSSTSSTFDRVVARLAKEGLVTVGDRRIGLTEKGRMRTDRPLHPCTLEELRQAWRSAPSFGDYEIRLMDAALSQQRPVPRAKLGQIAGVSTSSSTFDRTVSHLVKLGVLRIPAKGMLEAGPSLFLKEGK